MFLGTKVETNYVVVSSKVRPSYSVKIIRFGDVRKFRFLRGENLIEKSNVVEISFMCSKLFVCIWWLLVFVCFGEIIRFSRVSECFGKIQQLCQNEKTEFFCYVSIQVPFVSIHTVLDFRKLQF